ncbi:tape measure protein [Pseudomonas sp. BLCC-B13]|uniref:tape measure protein n=1 Tax=Pseudomonas sp. BLCC-B13 TaxID=3025314 RepID=UPI00234EC086|nr:tape measure protein [Pseudomonas sp. BLCC-B13]MDC7825271.1 tape measure protein [Pseudomonas sp. BLCC-B13]
MAEVELRVSADLDQATREVAGFRKEYADLVRQVEKPLRQVNATRELEASLEATGKRVQQAKQRLSELQAELIRTDSPTERLKQSFKEAAAELQKLQRTEAMQTNQLSRMRAELAGAGVDTSRLAAEQRRLNTEMSKALGTGRADAAARGIRERAAALQQQAIAQRQANAEAARDNLGVNRYRALQAEITKARQQYDLLRTSGKLSTQELAVAQQQLTQRIRESKNELKALSGAQGGIGGLEGLTTGRLAGAVGGIAGAAALAAQYAAAVDPIKNMRAQLDLATDSQEQLNLALADSARIADAAGAPLTDTAELYSKLIPPVRELGGSQQDAANTTEAFALGLRISGATAQQSAGAMQQYVQALNRGVFQAEEFNSVADGNIRLIRAFAQELGVTVGEFRNMVLAGEITSDMLLQLSNEVLPTLRAEAELMPETWASATTKLNNSWQQLLGQFDQATGASQALINRIEALTASLKLLGGGDADKAATGVANISAEFGRLVPLLNLAAIGAEKLGEIAGIKTFSQSAKGAVKEEGEVLQERKTQFDMHAAEMKALQQSAAKDGAAILEQQVKDTEAALKKQVDAERKAASELAKAKQDQLETQQRYKEALASLSAGPAQEASYGQASALKVGARNALQAGDVDEAKRQAQAALAVLQELAAAGENTYGFAGFIKELQAIEEGADQKGIDEAQKKLDAAKAAALQTKAALEELKDIKVAPTLDEEAQQKLLNDLAALAKQAGVILTIPATVTAQAPQGGTVDPSIPAAATGGILRGPGTGTSDSILARLSNGEGVLNARAVQHYGAGMVHQLNRLQLPKFATGGVVGTGLSLPPIPQPSPELLAGGGNAYLGDTTLVFPGGESLTVSVPASQSENLQLLRLKFGGTRRR